MDVAGEILMLHKALLSGVALIGLTGLASAADLYVKAPPVLYVPTWTGCYIGGHAGYGETTSSSQYEVGLGTGVNNGIIGTADPQFNDNFDNKGFVGGGQAGCQLQTGRFLWGLEGDWSSFSNSSSRNDSVSSSRLVTAGVQPAVFFLKRQLKRQPIAEL
jgi:outer membrane immunogenic protein